MRFRFVAGTADKRDPPPRQIAVYRDYLQMQAIAADRFLSTSADCLAGRLCLCVSFGQKGAELALATTIAGGAFLGVDASPERLKAAVRNGSCDFMVNTLDESLRVLKNELRKRTAVSVGLAGPVSQIIPAMVERGVQPDLIADASPTENETSAAIEHALSLLVERGAQAVNVQAANPPAHLTRIEVTWTTDNAIDLKRLDSIAVEHLPTQDQVRRRWMHQAAGYFHRQRPLQRVLGLSPGELSGLTHALQNAACGGQIQGSASIQWHDPTGEEKTVLLHPC